MNDRPLPGNLKDALAEIERLRRIVAKPLGAIWEQVEAESRAAWFGERKEIRELRGLLARLEWAVNCYDDPRCPACGAYKHGQPPGQHDPGCELAAALAGNDETPPRP